MGIPPIQGQSSYEGFTNDPNQDLNNVLEAIYKCKEGVYTEFKAWLKNHSQASGSEVSGELNQLATKYNEQLNNELNAFRNSHEGYNKVINGMNPQPSQDFYDYIQKIQDIINYNGPTTKPVPQPSAPNNQIQQDEQDVEDAIAKIKQEIQGFNSQLSAAQTQYQTALNAYNNALAEVNKCTDPTKKAQAEADLAQAQTALDAANKTLKAITTDPNYKALSQQLAAARAALQTFPTTDVAKADAAAAAAKQAESNAGTELTALNAVLAGANNNLVSASTDIQAALNVINPHPNNPVIDFNKLVVNGVTCNEVNGLIFPSGGLQGWGTSEGMGNWLRDAWKNGDMPLFQKLLNSYFHVCRQAPDHMGLMPWSIDKNGNALDKGSATDADEDIISTLMDAVAKDPTMTMTDSDGTTMKVSDMLKDAIQNFAKLDCGSANGLTGGSTQWTLGPGFTDYLDPTALAKMINYCNANGMASQAATINTSMQEMMQYVKNELSANGMPSSGGDGSCAISRLLYRMTEFYCSPLSAGYSSLKSDALNIVQNLLVDGFKNGAIKIAPSQWGTTINIQTPGSYTLAGAQASAPVYMAMMLLKDRGLLPESVASQLNAVTGAYNTDMHNQFNNLSQETAQQYSSNGNYFGLTLGILCASLLQEYSQ